MVKALVALLFNLKMMMHFRNIFISWSQYTFFFSSSSFNVPVRWRPYPLPREASSLLPSVVVWRLNHHRCSWQYACHHPSTGRLVRRNVNPNGILLHTPSNIPQMHRNTTVCCANRGNCWCNTRSGFHKFIQNSHGWVEIIHSLTSRVEKYP